LPLSSSPSPYTPLFRSGDGAHPAERTLRGRSVLRTGQRDPRRGPVSPDGRAAEPVRGHGAGPARRLVHRPRPARRAPRPPGPHPGGPAVTRPRDRGGPVGPLQRDGGVPPPPESSEQTGGGEPVAQSLLMLRRALEQRHPQL